MGIPVHSLDMSGNQLPDSAKLKVMKRSIVIPGAQTYPLAVPIPGTSDFSSYAVAVASTDTGAACSVVYVSGVGYTVTVAAAATVLNFIAMD